MAQNEIQISRKITTQLLHYAQLSPEAEICGLIGSQNGLPCTCYPISNRADLPAQRFLLDAAEQIAAMVKIREAGEELFAIYHSHPKAPAEPSPTDMGLVTYPNALYLIISLNTKGVLEMRGFKMDGQAPEEVPLVLAQSDS